MLSLYTNDWKNIYTKNIPDKNFRIDDVDNSGNVMVRVKIGIAQKKIYIFSRKGEQIYSLDVNQNVFARFSKTDKNYIMLKHAKQEIHKFVKWIEK